MMMNDGIEVSEMELHAFIDGELDAVQSQRIEKALSANPALAEQAAGYLSDKAMLKKHLGPIVNQPVPEAWIAAANKAPIKKGVLDWRKIIAAAAVILVMLTAGLSFVHQRLGLGDDVVLAALRSRGAITKPHQIVVVETPADASRYAETLSRIVASNIKIPDLTRLDYRLASIQLYGSAAELVYRDPKNKIFTLYLRRSNGTPRFDQFERGGLRICIWQDDRVSMVMAGDISVALMQKLASLTYIGMTV